MRIPLYSLIATAIFVIAAVILLLFAPEGRETMFLSVFASTIPALVAAFAAERASRDIRNGVVEEKARAGATSALRDTGVTEVVESTQRGQSSIVAMQALAELLKQNTKATVANTEMGNQNG